MVGDVNLFVQTNSYAAEASVMIAGISIFLLGTFASYAYLDYSDPQYRRRGFGREALSLLFGYGILHFLPIGHIGNGLPGTKLLNIDTYIVRIGLANIPSLRLFLNLGFCQVSVSDVFREATLELSGCSASQLYSQSLDVREAVSLFGPKIAPANGGSDR